MRKFLVALILAGVMVFSGNQWATADHKKAAFVVPHEVAIWMNDHKVMGSQGQQQFFEKHGCPDVTTFPLGTFENIE